MGIQAAQVMKEQSGGAGWKPAVAGRTALRAVPSPPPPSPREQLRAAVVERLEKDATELIERMNEFVRQLENSTFVATLSQVVSVSSLAQELWKMPRQVPAARAHLAQTLGLAADADEASLVRALLGEVRQAFTDFDLSPAGRDFRERYDTLLFTFEERNVLPIVLGYDVGPMVGELARLGLKDETSSGQSLLIDPRTVAVMPLSLEAPEDQVWVSGASTSQLAQLVTQLRQINPLLSNRQARGLLRRVLTERDGARKNLGRPELDSLHDGSRQLLRLHAVERLSVW